MNDPENPVTIPELHRFISRKNVERDPSMSASTASRLADIIVGSRSFLADGAVEAFMRGYRSHKAKSNPKS